METLLLLLKWFVIWALVTAVVYAVAKVCYALITKPNLRAYLIHTLKDVKNMYYRYHV